MDQINYNAYPIRILRIKQHIFILSEISYIKPAPSYPAIQIVVLKNGTEVSVCETVDNIYRAMQEFE